MKYISILVIGIAIAVSCNTSKKSTNSATGINEKQLIEIQNTNFNLSDSVQIIPNKNKTCYLLLNETLSSVSNPVSHIKYIVIDAGTKQIIYKNEQSNSLVRWYSNNELLLTQFFGIIEQPTASNKKTFIINILTEEIKEIDLNTIINQ